MSALGSASVFFARIKAMVLDATDLLFGFDFFVSYSHGDGASYPQTLTDELESSGFRVFLDSRIYVPGDDLRTATRRRVRMSKKLILIARPGALESYWVLQEVKECLQAGRTPIVIDVNRTVEDASDTVTLKGLLNDKLQIREQIENLDGRPAPETVAQLVQSFRSTRQDTLRMRWVTGAALLMAVFAVTAGWQAFVADRARAHAEEQRNLAERERQVAIGRQLTVQAEADLTAAPYNFGRSLMLAVEAQRRLDRNSAQTRDATRILYRALELAAPRVDKLDHAGAVAALAVDGDGSLVASGDHAGKVLVWRADDRRILVELQHGDEILHTIAFDPASERLATVTKDDRIQRIFTLRLWAIQDGELLLRRNLGSEVSTIAFSRDGKTLLLSTPGALSIQIGGGFGIRRFNVTDGEELRPLRLSNNLSSDLAPYLLSPNAGSVVRISGDLIRLEGIGEGLPDREHSSHGTYQGAWFSADGDHLIVRRDRSLQVLSVADLTVEGEVGFEQRTSMVSYSPVSRQLAVVLGNTVRIWDLRTKEEVSRFVHDGVINALTFAGKGAVLVVGDANGRVRIWEMQDAGRSTPLQITAERGIHVKHTPNGKRGWSANQADIPDWGQALMNLPKEVWPLEMLAVKGSGQMFATASGHYLSIWDASGQPLHPRLDLGEGVLAMQFGADRGRLVVAGENNIHVLEPESGRLFAKMSNTPHRTSDGMSRTDSGTGVNGNRLPARLEIAPGGRYFSLGAAYVRDVQIWDIDNQKRIFDAGPHTSFLPDGKHIVTDTQDNLLVRDLETGLQQAFAPPLSDRHHIIALEGPYVLTADDERVVVWDAESQRRLGGSQEPITGRIIEGAVAADGSMFAVATGRTVTIFDTAMGTVLHSIPYEQILVGLAFDPHGPHIATAEVDPRNGHAAVHVWSLTKFKELWYITVPGFSASEFISRVNLSFSPDNRRLVMMRRESHAAHAWLWSPSALADLACARTDANLSYADWRRSLGEEAYRPICGQNPLRPIDLLEYAVHRRESGDVEASRTALRAAVTASAEAPVDVNAMLCYEGGKARQLEIVSPACEQLLHRRPQDPYSLMVVALLRIHNGQYGAAADTLAQYLSLAENASGDITTVQQEIGQLKGWISDLEEGRDPFNGQVLRTLERIAE